MSYVEPQEKKPSYTELYAAEVQFQQMKKEYQSIMLKCPRDKPCLPAAQINVELQNQLGVIATLLDELKPKDSIKKRQQIIRNLDKLSQEYDDLMKKLNEQSTIDQKNTDLEVMTGMYHANILPWGFSLGFISLLLIWSAI